MAREREERGRNKEPQARQRQDLEHPPLTEPVVVFDGKNSITISHNQEQNRTEVYFTAGEWLLQSSAMMPNTDIVNRSHHEKRTRPTPGAQKEPEKQAVTQEQLLAQEQGEYPEITIEGWPVRAGSYKKDEQTYRLRIAHHPNSDERDKVAVFYDLLAEGEKAKECFAVRVTDISRAVHVTGELHTRMTKKRGGGMQEVREIQIDSLEKLPQGQVDSPDMYHEKRTLADLE